MKSTFPQCGKTQRGVALLVALLVVALATVLIAGLLDRGGLAAARTRNALRAQQAQVYARGLENYAAEVLVRAQGQGLGYDAADSVWAIPLPPTPVPGGTIAAQMSDLNGRFNLNNLDPAYDTQGVWRGKFVLLLTALKLDPAIAGHVVTWMDATVPATVDDQFYLAQLVPYRRAARAFAHVSELRLVAGIDGDVYATLAPYVSALPEGTPINVNTAGVPVLMTLGANVTQEMAQAIWQQGGAHFSGVDQVQKAQPALAVIEHPECFDVRSNYFRARGLITLDGLPFEFDSLIERRSGPGGGIHVLQRNRGGD
ncbi:MAG TPA: type II secretion system minor pseudopilin GspK [Rudaea sp.]|jgi:general secretion pathway protein K|nr:type II secretion system minor pseudopilin GspK [Rudaea sp.]